MNTILDRTENSIGQMPTDIGQVKPFALGFREPMRGVVSPSALHGDDHTYMGECTSDPRAGDVSDYESD